MQRIEGPMAKVITLHPTRPADPRERQDVGHRGDEAPDFGQDYGNAPEIQPPAEPPRDQPRPEEPRREGPRREGPRPEHPAAFGASSGETWANAH